jgi:hypothetical protein
MARLKKNAVISGLSGQIGKEHYARQTKDGRTIISVKPDFSNRQFSEAQLEEQSDLAAASAYARVASRTNPIYAQIAKKTSKKKVLNAYNVAVRDWFRPPVITRIEWDNGNIQVMASDDTMVTRVTVTVVSDEGKRLEQAEAQSIKGVFWKYQTTHSGLVRVEAWDFAGNVTRHEFLPHKSYFIWND